jgi:putative molybdopterin biosynthesis protein
VWEEGLVVAKDNPKGIRAVTDLRRRNISIVNREPGSGTRMLLDARLRSLGMYQNSLRGYQRIALGHLAAARQVLEGEADCCIATSSVVRLLELGFIPLTSARYDLVVRRRHLALPQVQALFNTLALAAFRHELERMGGYDTSVAGQRLM